MIRKPEAEQLLESSQASFVMVKAMPGFGKTAAFARAAGKWEDGVWWYSLDVTDNDSDCFLSGLEQMWERADGKKAGETTGQTPASRILSLVQRVKRWETHIHIVWDHLQVISSDEIFQLFLFLYYYTKETISFIFLTNKNVPTLFLPLLSGKGGCLMTEDALRLSPEEAWQSMGKKSGLSMGVTALLAEDLCGWPLGLQWVLKYLKDEQGQCMLRRYEKECSGPDREHAAEWWNRVLQESLLSDYMDKLLVENCPGRMQDFVKKTAVFDTFTWEMCQAVFPKQFSREDFLEVVSNHGFVQKISGETESYRYGMAFRACFFDRLSVEERTGICRRAALWYEKKKDFVRMAEYAVSGGQEDILVQAMEQYGRELLSGENRQILGRMIEYLEKNAVLLPPEISGVVAQYFYSRGNFYKMEEYLNAADSAYVRENKYGCYRNLYRGLIRLEEEPGRYEKEIRDAVFFLKRTGQRFPYLSEKEEKCLRMLTERDEEKEQKTLHVHMFGDCRVIVLADGRELNWRTKKGRELFAYLLDMGGNGVGRRQLIELLWQDEIPGNAVAMLHNMIYNIRKELSAYHLETLITYENRCYRIHTEYIETDLWRIKDLAKLVEQQDLSALKKEYKYFLEYWGGFLEDLDSFWVEDRRAYYDEIFKRGCRLLADSFVKEKEYETALKFYKNILFLDAYSEETVEKMILVYGRQKRWKKLKQCYENLETVLKKDLGICPGEAVLAAYHKYL